jgi:Tol biopolymer transport system component
MDSQDKPNPSPERSDDSSSASGILLLVPFIVLCLIGIWAGTSGFFSGHLSENYRNLRREGPSLETPVFSADSRRVAFSACSRTCGIRIVDIATGSSSTFAPSEKESRANGIRLESYRHPSFHPDGKHVVYSRYRQQSISGSGFDGDTHSVSIATLDGTIVQDALRSSTRKSHPLMLNDGERVIFASYDPSLAEKTPAAAELMLGNIRTGSTTPVPGAQRAWQLVPKRTTSDKLEFWAFRTDRSPYETGGLFQINIKNGDWKGLKGDTASSTNFLSMPDGTWAHLRRANDIDGYKGAYVYDIFIRSETGDTRITHTGSHLKDVAASPDGKLFAAIIKPVAEKREYLAVFSIEGREILRIGP